MHRDLDRNLFLVKEHLGIFKAANNYDIFDPETGQMILECREDQMGLMTKILRFTDFKRMTPFHIDIRTPDGVTILSVQRGASMFLSRVKVVDGEGQYMGGFKQKFFSIGGKFDVLDAQEQAVCSLNGKWTGWEFRFVSGTTELARVSKKWAGLGKEFFTSADNYILQIGESVRSGDPRRPLILGAVMCIDMVLKE